MTKFLIGYEIGTGNPVEAELHHLFISGVTQHSGKTTALEAFINRIQPRRALVFRSGRGEIGFDGANRIPPFFRDRTDWKFVEGLLGAHLHEKMKFYRGDIMRAVRGAKTLKEVHEHVKKRLEKARKDSFVEKILYELEQYLQEVVPTLDQYEFSKTLTLKDGMNLIDLEGFPLAVQQLVIAACADLIMEAMTDTILVVPEAWQMIPQERPSPVSLAVENIARQGGKIGNYVWLDSQQLTGIKLDILRNFDITLFGRQTLDREKERVAKTIPGRKIKPDDVHGLEIGEFYIIQYGEEVRKVYVCPAWLPEGVAQQVAKGERPLSVTEPYKPKPKVIDVAYEEEKAAMVRKLESVEQALKEARETILRGEVREKALLKELHDLEERTRKSFDGQVRENLSSVFPDLKKRIGSAVRDGIGEPAPPTPTLEYRDMTPDQKRKYPAPTEVTSVEEVMKRNEEWVRRITREEIAKVGKLGVVEVPAKRVILSTFLEEHIARYRAAIKKLAPRNQQYLAYLAARDGVWVGTKQAAVALFGYGSDAATIAKSLHELGAAEYDSQHGKVRYVLPERLKNDLQATYELKDEELANIHAALQHEFLAFMKVEA